MRVIDPGHVYELAALDGGEPQTLVFVKRVGDAYPGNVGAHGGVVIQEVLRVLMHRLRHVDGQLPCEETKEALVHLGSALLALEMRAARRHGRHLALDGRIPFEEAPTCSACGHIGCRETCPRADATTNEGEKR